MIFHSYVNVYQRVNSVWTQNLNSDWMAGCDGWLTIVNFASFSHVFSRSGWDLGDGWYPVVTEHSHCFDDNMAIFWRYSIILSKSSRNWMIFFGTCLQSSKNNWMKLAISEAMFFIYYQMIKLESGSSSEKPMIGMWRCFINLGLRGWTHFAINL